MNESDKSNGGRIRRTQSGLVMVDFQERLLPAVRDAETVLARATLLAHAARELGMPVWVTEQYPRGLGPTVAGLRDALDGLLRREKLAFSALGAEGLAAELSERGVTDVVLCGIETHVCVCQTALDLRDRNYRVFVPLDAVAARRATDHEAGLARLWAVGATPVSVEMVIFEWLARAGTEEFKRLLPRLK